jgi:beta-lactamase regulating signal transducer with metallopeptidase domain
MNALPTPAFWLQSLGLLALQAATLLLAAGLAQTLVRAARWRRAVWLAALTGLALMLANALAGLDRHVARWFATPSKAAPQFVVRANLPVESGPTLAGGVATELIPPIPDAAASPAEQLAASAGVWWPAWLWLGGALAVGLWTLMPRLWLAFATRRAGVSLPGDDRERLDALARRLNLRRPVRVLVSAKLAGPIAFGVLRPGIGLPADFWTAHSRTEQDTMLAHELAHHAARDPLWLALADLLLAALWWHPLVWWARRQFRATSEAAADEASLVVEDGPAVLAGCLVALASRLQRRGILGMAGFRSGLGRRVERLLRLRAGERPAVSRGWPGVFAATAGVTSLGAAVAVSAWLFPAQAASRPALLAVMGEALNRVSAAEVEPSSETKVESTTSESAAGSTVLPEATSLVAPAPNPGTKAASPHGQASDLIQDSKLLFELGYYAGAKAKFEAALKQEPNNEAALHYLERVREVEAVKANEAAQPDGAGVQPTESSLQPAQVHSVGPPGQCVIRDKLQRIVLEKVGFPSPGTPLQDVVRFLSKEIKARDPDGQGINFLMVPSPTPADDTAASANLVNVRILLEPALVNVRAGDALDAVVRAAERPIRHTLEAYGVVLHDASPADSSREPTQLFTRTFKVEPRTLAAGLEAIAGPGRTNLTSAEQLRWLFAAAGLEFARTNAAPADGPPAKALFYNDRNGLLLVRATAAELQTVEQLLQVLNTAPPQVTIEAKFVELAEDTSRSLGFDWFLDSPRTSTNAPDITSPPASTGGVGTLTGIMTNPQFREAVAALHQGGTNGVRELRGDQLDWPGRDATNAANIRVTAALGAGLTGVLTEAQYRALLRALEQRESVDVLSAPRVTTLSGRQAQIQMVDTRSVLTGINPLALVQPGAPPAAGAVPFLTSTVPTGPTLDIIPMVAADGYTLELNVLAGVTDFLGYDQPPADAKVNVWQDGQVRELAVPLPRFRVRQMQTKAAVRDGQTLVLGGLLTETPAKDQTGEPRPDSQPARKQLLVFVTATTIDAAGNRVHPSDNLPFDQNRVPSQPLP